MTMRPDIFLTELFNIALSKLDIQSEVALEHPADLSHGDFSCNIAMVLAKQTGKNPRELAEDIIANIPTHEYVQEVNVAGPGFINIRLTDTFFADSIKVILEAPDEWGRSNYQRGTKVLIEHSSPNLFKPFHIGHLVNNTLGEALVRLYTYTGAEVTKLSFPSDVSPGIAKAVWAVRDNGWENELTIEKIGDAYVHGVDRYDTDGDAKTEMNAINTSLYNKDTTTKEWEIYEKGRQLSLDYFMYITKRLGSTFDELIFESDSEVAGKRIVHEHTPGVFEESDGAVIFRGSAHGLFDNVFINSAGFGTYLTKDIGLVSKKFALYAPFSDSVTVTDIEQKHHFELVKKAAELLNPEWAEKSTYIQHGRLSLSTGKISSRKGGVPLAEDIIDSVKARALERMAENEREQNEDVAEQVAIAAVKYAIARVSMGKNIVFDLESSLSLEGDTGPYLQYAYARTQSIIRKGPENLDATKLHLAETPEVLRLLYRFPLVVERATKTQEPHHVATYLSELAGTFNSWYAHEQILDGGEAQNAKLALTHAVAHTLKNGLWVLGMGAPEQM